MTVIAAIKHQGKIYMAGDSCSSGDGTLFITDKTKVAKLGKNCLVGHCGSARMGNIITYVFKLPKHPKQMDTDTYMASLFADALRKCLTKNGCITITDSNAEMSGQLLVAYKGNIYVIDGAFCSFRLYENFIAIGSGGEVARGALYATQTLPPEERLQIACKAAENYCEGVRSPFYILTL